MTIQLIEGEFSQDDAIELLAQMINVKVKYHENKITPQSEEEDIKRRETKIKKLQKQLFELRDKMNLNNRNVKIDAQITIN